MSVQGPPWLLFEPLKLLHFDFNADPDPSFHSNADTNPDPASQNNWDPYGAGSVTLARTEEKKTVFK
jgi:hypothetical protein